MTGTIRLDTSMSLDCYVTGPHDSVEEPMGVGGFRLFNWLDLRHDPGPNGQVYDELRATRAVISGRRTYEHAGRWQGDHHDGVPVFVLTHHVPDDWNYASCPCFSVRDGGCSTTCRQNTLSSNWYGP